MTRVLVVLLVLVLAPILLFAALVLLLDPNDYRDELETLGGEVLGRRLELKGPVVFVPGLAPSLRMTDVIVTNTPWGQDPYLAKLDELEGRIELLDALRGRLRPTHLAATGGVVYLEQRADGSDNYSLASGTPGAVEVPYLELEGIVIHHRRPDGGHWNADLESLTFDQAADGSRRVAARFSLGDEFPVNFSARRGLAADAPWQATAKVGRLAEMSTAGRLASLTGTDGLEVTLRGADLEALLAAFDLETPVSGPFEARGRVRIDAGTIAVQRLQATAGEMGVTGAVSVHLGKPRRIVAELEAKGPHMQSMDARLTLDAGRTPPALDATVKGTGVDLGFLLRRLGWTSGLEDRIDLDVSLSAQGQDLDALIAHADGRVVAISGPGALDGHLLDLWAGDLITAMLSPKWQHEDSTAILCGIVSLDVRDGVATLDHGLLDTERVTLAGSGTIDLAHRSVDLVLAPRPKSASLVSLARPAQIAGPWSDPQVTTLSLPSLKRIGGIGTLALLNPAFLLASFSRAGDRHANRCVETVQQVTAMDDAN